VAAIVAATGMVVLGTPAVRAGSGAAGLKAVVIVGPASSSTWEYLQEGERIARQAEAQGMDVRRIFTPRATWKRVKQNIQGANLVVYLGHGNGWPSIYAPYRPESKNGFGLNPCEDDCGTSAPTKYFGEAFIRNEIKLAPKAVVYLHRLCYAAGNSESGMPPVFNKDLATERVSNFAAGFLDAGAAAVFAYGWGHKVDLPATLANSNKSMDEIFQMKGSAGDYYDGFVGWDDYYRRSTRTDGARIHLDPHRRHGHLRAVTGDLTMTANEWRGQGPPPDEEPPTLTVKSLGTTDGVANAGTEETLTFSPNGDGIADRMVINRVLSEPAYVDVEVRNAGDEVVRSFTRLGEKGAGESYWDGRNDNDGIVADGLFRVRLQPRDRAGNVGEASVVDVRVLSTLTRLKASTGAIHVNDGDDLASATELSTSLRRDARVTFEVRRSGNVVRSRFADEPVGAGDISWRWDGTNDAGETVPNGGYKVFITATTDDGTMRFSVPVRVGNWRFALDDRTPARGQRIRLIARTTEPMSGPPTLEISQPGLEPRLETMSLPGPDRAVLTFTLAKGGTAGTLGLRVIAQDTGGQEEVGGLSVPLD
jgi:flagellar hook assembly protein FlgD